MPFVWGQSQWGVGEDWGVLIDPSLFPFILVAVDWDNDGYINRFGTPTDALNIIPDPLTWGSIERHRNDVGGAGGDSEEIWETNDYGLKHIRVTFSDNAFGQYLFGVDTGFTVVTVPVTPGIEHTVSAWVRGVSNYDSIPFAIWVRGDDPPSYSFFGGFGFTITGEEWQQVGYTFTPTTDYAFIMVGKNNSAGTNPTIDITGFMVVKGSELPNAFNIGTEISLWDNVTEYCLSANWQLGKPNADAKIAAEGTADIVLNNVDRLFSPEYEESPLYGYMIPNLPVIIELYDPHIEEYVRKWTGWVDAYDVDAGRTRELQTNIAAKQGLLRLSQSTLNTPLLFNVSSGEAIERIINDTDWIPPTFNTSWRLDVSELDVNTVFDASGAVIAEFDEGQVIFEFVGDEWDSTRLTPTKAIEDIIEVEDGWFWLNEYGRPVFRDRYHGANLFLAATEDFDVTVDRELIDGEYDYGGGLYNAVEITYYPKTLEEDTLVWQSREPIIVSANSIKNILPSFELEEGQKVSVVSILPFGTGSEFTAEAGGVDASTSVSISIEVTNDKAQVVINNSSVNDIEMSFTLRGTIIRSSGGTIYAADDPATIIRYNLRMVHSANKKLLSSEAEAQAYGDWLLQKHKNPLGVFNNVQLRNRMYKWYRRQMYAKIGSTVNISDEQTGATNKRHLIIGEKHRWTPRLLHSTLVTEFVGRYNLWLLDVSELDNTTILGA